MRIGLTFDYNGKGIKAAKVGLASLLKSAIGVQAGVAGLTAAFVKLGKESVAAAVAEEKAYRVLGQTLSSAGFTQAVDGVKALIDAQQLATGVAEDQLIPAYTTLFNSLQSVSEAQAALEVAQSVSLATGKDLSQVTSAFARASKGSTTALQRLAIGLSKADLQAKSFGEILQILQNRFGGTTAAAIDTTSVKFDRLRIAVGEAKEEIGKGLIEAFTSAASASRTSVDQMQADIIRLGTTIGDFFRGVGGLSGAVSQIEIPFQQAVTNALNNGFERSYLGKFSSAIGALTEYGSALRQITEAEASAGLAAVYTGGPRADRMTTSQMGMRLLSQRYAMEESARKKAATAEAARRRATEAQRKRAAELESKQKELAKQFDLELIGLAAAKRKAADEDTLTRLTALQTIAMSAYDGEKQSINELDELIKKLTATQNQYTAAVNASAAAWAGIVMNPNAGSFRLAEQGANQGLGAGSMAAPSSAQFRQAEAAMGVPVTVNIGGSVIAQQDLQQAVLDAVNTATRGGGALRGLPQSV